MKATHTCNDCKRPISVGLPINAVLVMLGENERIAVCTLCYQLHYKTNLNVIVAIPYSINNATIINQLMLMKGAMVGHIDCNACGEEFNLEQMDYLIDKSEKEIAEILPCKECRRIFQQLKDKEIRDRVFTPLFPVEFEGFLDKVVKAQWNPNTKELIFGRLN